MSLAIVGTSTGVGKTVVSALLLWRYRELGLAYWKPISSGARPREKTGDSDIVGRLGPPDVPILEERYRFALPASPHLAAAAERLRIRPASLVSAFRGHERMRPGRLVVEGIGGLLVPLTHRGYLLVDFLGALELPCLLVATTGLGTFNHTLLSAEALARRNIPLAGVVLSGPPQPGVAETLRSLVRPPVLLELPHIGSARPDGARGDSASHTAALRSALFAEADRFDPAGALGRHFSPRKISPDDRVPGRRRSSRTGDTGDTAGRRVEQR